MNKKIFLVIFILIVLLPMGLSAKSQKDSPESSVDPVVLAAFGNLQDYIADLPDQLVAKGQRKSLTKKLSNAKRAYLRGQPCTASNILRAYLNETQALRQGKRLPIAEDLNNRGRMLRYGLLESLPEGQTCPGHKGIGVKPDVGIVRSDNKQIEATTTFGEPRMLSVEAGGELFTQIQIPGISAKIGEPGFPAVPVLRRLIAVPWGAEVSINITAPPTIRETIQANLYPFQPQPVDQVPPQETFVDPPFEKDEEVYETDAFYPEEICTATPLGRARDLQIAQISCATGRYNPVTDTLILYDTLNFEVTFSVDGHFLTTASLSPFEPITDIYTGAVLNRAAVYDFVYPDISTPTNFGEELLILTHPTFREAADLLAQWKRDKGIVTSVFEVCDGDGPGPDMIHTIWNFIKERYDTCTVRPSYILLLGDYEFIPHGGETYGTCTNDFTGERQLYGGSFDYKYALYDFCGSLLPTFAVGRIPVDTLEQAQAVVDKIIQYESSPPTSESFYENVSIASYFQCCRDGEPDGRTQRSFIESSEAVRDELLSQGYGVERIYTTSTHYNSDYAGDPTPRRYYGGTLLPVPLRPESGFVWDGDSFDIIDAFNDGRFLILHRDHGGPDQWVDPHFSTEHVYEILENGDLLPVVFSVNCASGLFDNEFTTKYGVQPEYTYLAEVLLRKADGGAVGVLGDTRNSPTWANSALTLGFFDSIWPNTVPEFGNDTSKRRLGDILNHGKMYLFNQIGMAGTTEPIQYSDAVNDLIIWHVIGDPTLEMWTSRPVGLPGDFTAVLRSESMSVYYNFEGATITALQELEGELVPVGRGVVTGGEALLEFVTPPYCNVPILLSANFENAVGRLLTPTLEPDQVNDVETGVSRGCGSNTLGHLFQSFTPSASSLAAVDLRLRTGGSFPSEGFTTTINIRSGTVGGTQLGTATAFVSGPQASGVQIEVRFEFSSPIPLNAGETYVIEWVTPGDVILTWMVAKEDPDGSYLDGTAFGCAGQAIQNEDFIFSTYAHAWQTTGYKILADSFTDDEGKSWIEMELVTENYEPVPGALYQVTMPDGSVSEGTLDENGKARLSVTGSGNCHISFPVIDVEAWIRI